MPFLIILAALAGLTANAKSAAAQSSDDLAARIGTVARAMGDTATEPWNLNGTVTGAASRGNTDTTNVHATAVYVRDSGVWRFGSYGSAALDTQNGERANERAGVNLALARRYTAQSRIVLLDEVVRAPLDGLTLRHLLGGMVLWTPVGGGRIEMNVYAGAGWAREHFVADAPRADYGAGLSGAAVSIALSAHSSLNAVTSYTGDLGLGTNYKLGSSVALKAALNSVLGLQMAYGVNYDHAPPAGKVRTNHAVNAGITVGLKGKAASRTAD
jgi:putative salt-induced outer membrane protein YdiY